MDVTGIPSFDRTPASDVHHTYVVANIADVIAPVVSSIERHNPTAQNTNSQTLTYKVTFSEAVTGVDAFDFVFSPDSTEGGKQWQSCDIDFRLRRHVPRTVSADTDGTYNLDLVPIGHGIVDTASNPMTDTIPTTGIDHTYVSIAGRDNTRPTVSSIDRYDPVIPDTDSRTLIYKVTFSEDVTGVDKTDFVMSPDNTGEPSFTFPPSNQILHESSPNRFSNRPNVLSDTITVADVGTLTSILVGVDITHPTIQRLTIELIAPDGTTVTFHNRTGGYSDYVPTVYSRILAARKSREIGRCRCPRLITLLPGLQLVPGNQPWQSIRDRVHFRLRRHVLRDCPCRAERDVQP